MNKTRRTLLLGLGVLLLTAGIVATLISGPPADRDVLSAELSEIWKDVTIRVAPDEEMQTTAWVIAWTLDSDLLPYPTGGSEFFRSHYVVLQVVDAEGRTLPCYRHRPVKRTLWGRSLGPLDWRDNVVVRWKAHEALDLTHACYAEPDYGRYWKSIVTVFPDLQRSTSPGPSLRGLTLRASAFYFEDPRARKRIQDPPWESPVARAVFSVPVQLGRNFQAAGQR